MSTQKVPKDKIHIYQKIFDVFTKDHNKVKFEFITTFDRPRNIEK